LPPLAGAPPTAGTPPVPEPPVAGLPPTAGLPPPLVTGAPPLPPLPAGGVTLGLHADAANKEPKTGIKSHEARERSGKDMACFLPPAAANSPRTFRLAGGQAVA